MRRRRWWVLVLLAGAAVVGRTEEAELPLSAPPQTLRDETGKPETDLVDPFRRGERADGGAADGTLRTSLGELPREFKILSILIPDPADTNKAPMALIQLSEASEPHLVRVGDQVRVDRSGAARVGTRARTHGALSEDARRALDHYMFYLTIKDIQPTYIEAYHSKKRPDDTVILSW